MLTPKQQRFANEYLIDLNATQAAIRAGYSEKTAGVISHENLKKPEISEYIQAAMDKRQSKIERTQLDVLTDIESVKADAMQKIADKDGNMLMANHAAALKALELEGKHRKMFTDKVEHTGADGGPIQFGKIERVILKK